MMKVVYILIFLCLVLVYSYRQIYFLQQRTKQNNFLFCCGLAIKIMGALFLFYLFPRPFGDSYEYFEQAQTLRTAFETDFSIGWKILTTPPEAWAWETRFFGDQFHSHIKNDFDSFSFVKSCLLISICCMNNYLICTFFFAFVSHHFLWKLFCAFTQNNSNILTSNTLKSKIIWFVLIYCFPSTIIWSSGLLKDTLVYWCLIGVFLFFVKKEKNWPLFVTSICVIYLMKAYLFLQLGSLALIVYGYSTGMRKLPFANAINFFVITASISGLLVSFSFLIKDSTHFWGQFHLTGIVEYISGIENWNTRPGQNTSFHYGDAFWTPSKLIWTAPIAIITGLFRPFLWEYNSPLMTIFAIESLSLFTLSLYSLKKLSLVLFKELIQKPTFIFVGLSIISFGYILGISTFNFGALSRYKTPLFLLVLALIYYIQQVKSIKQTTS